MKIDEEGYVKIFDFGLAKTASVVGTALTKTVIGTPGHMAPEFFKPGGTGTVAFSGAVDVFAFGSTILKFVTKALPAALLSFPPSVGVAPTFFDNIGASLPADVRERLNRSLSNDPFVRPTMGEIASCVEREMLKDRHKIIIGTPSKVYQIDSVNRSIEIKSEGRGQIKLRYDGYDMRIRASEAMYT